VERASKLTGQLLAFARRQPLKPQVFNVGSQVEAVAQLIRPLVGARIRIDVDIADINCFAIADIAQFETALINRTGPGCLNRFSASISGASAGVRLPSGLAAG
jgi:C4-dicarboxylate-specific signal transduction histidine kinase